MEGVKKAFLVLVGALLCLPFVSALDPAADEVCVAKGFGFSVSRWYWANDSYIETDYMEGHDVFIEGNARRINWSSDTYIDGVVFKTTRTYTSDGGYNGTIPKTTLSSDLNYVVFCKNDTEIPEFGVFGLVFASILGLIFAVTRHK